MSLAIAGLVPLSSVDWPGHLVATVFAQGCPWRCTYCHNESLIPTRAATSLTWEDVTALLHRRVGLLDGVVFTGGEALRQRDTIEAARQVKDLGMKVGVHTAGAYPANLARILPHTDWVGLDIKALPGDYGPVTGIDAGALAWRSLDTVLSSGTDYEVRTTVHPGSIAAARFAELLAALRARGVRTFALQEARTTGTPAEFRRVSETWDMSVWKREWDSLTSLAREAGFSKLSIRTA